MLLLPITISDYLPSGGVRSQCSKMAAQVEVAVKEAKDDNTEDEGTEEAALRKTTSSSFERVSQEIEKASQELPQAKQALSRQSSRANGMLAEDMLPRAELQGEQAAERQPGAPDRAPALGARSRAEHAQHSAAQRMPLELLDEQRTQVHQRAGCSSQDPLRPSSQQSDSALSRGTTQSISEAGRPPPPHSKVSRQPSGQQQPPACVGVRVNDAGHILPGRQQPGSDVACNVIHQHGVQHAARGLQASAPEHRQPLGESQRVSHRGPPQHNSHARQRQQPASQPAQAQSSGRVSAPLRANSGLAHSGASQRAPHQTQSQRHEAQHSAAERCSGHTPIRAGQDHSSAPRPVMQPGNSLQAQRQLSEPHSRAPGTSMQHASQAPQHHHSGPRTSQQGVRMQPLRGSRAQQYPPREQQSSGLPGLARHDSAVDRASDRTGPETCVLGAALPSSKAASHIQQPAAGSSRPVLAAAQNTGVFAGKSTGVFADDEEDEEDADWDAEVAKLLESAALSRPNLEPAHPGPQVPTLQAPSCTLILLYAWWLSEYPSITLTERGLTISMGAPRLNAASNEVAQSCLRSWELFVSIQCIAVEAQDASLVVQEQPCFSRRSEVSGPAHVAFPTAANTPKLEQVRVWRLDRTYGLLLLSMASLL